MKQMDIFQLMEETRLQPSIKGKNICITGTLMAMTREKAYEHIRSKGGIPQSSVTKETDYLVVGIGQRAGNCNGKKSAKEKKALSYREKGLFIQVINEKQLMTMLGTRGGEKLISKRL
ncbi:BRCT domain-containing protein [Anoxynatronum sibiricum]|uniref:BRCT domain-containing protein n=1 Tax=Anoxynatronum sibiricum TaxID=210623 RepID=A0ABU9VX44_9CLOT